MWTIHSHTSIYKWLLDLNPMSENLGGVFYSSLKRKIYKMMHWSLFHRQRAALERQLMFHRSLFVESGGLEQTQDISRPWVFSYFTLLKLLGLAESSEDLVKDVLWISMLPAASSPVIPVGLWQWSSSNWWDAYHKISWFTRHTHRKGTAGALGDHKETWLCLQAAKPATLV